MNLILEKKTSTSECSYLSPFAKAFLLFAYKEEKSGREATGESFQKRFGKKKTAKYLKEITSVDSPCLIKNNGTYTLSRSAETAIRRVMNFI